MTRDVYADDEGPVEFANGDREQRARFHIVADADPGVLVAICGVLNLLCATPLHFHMESSDGIAVVQAVVDRCVEVKAGLIARKLAQLILVHSVNVSCEPLSLP